MGETALKSVRRLQLTRTDSARRAWAAPFLSIGPARFMIDEPTTRTSIEIFLTWCIDAATCRVR
jgi:hypothetical protein